MEKEDELCKDAWNNPNCPYLSEIKKCGEDIAEMKNALLGDLEHEGLIGEVRSIRAWINSFLKPILITVVGGVLVLLIEQFVVHVVL
jgi:hypothetical protein